MSYRDDVDAVYERAAALQREVDQLRAQLSERSSSVDAERQKARIEARVSRSELEREQAQLEARVARADAERQRAVQEVSSLKAEIEKLRAGDPSGDVQLGPLAARLTRAERAVVRRLVELLAEDDFSVPAIRRNWQVLDDLVAELRLHLATHA